MYYTNWTYVAYLLISIVLTICVWGLALDHFAGIVRRDCETCRSDRSLPVGTQNLQLDGPVIETAGRVRFERSCIAANRQARD